MRYTWPRMQALLSRIGSIRQEWLAAGFLLVLSYFTVVHGYWNPQALYWDENYHIASAQKYQNGIFFMEPHPPLGKMMIALGEALLDVNPDDNQFIGTDYAQNPPAGFSFVGYRFFPVLFAWLSVPVLFAIFLLLTRNTLWSTLLSFLYVFDNALLVHLRSAMLESTLLFFCLLTVLGFLLVEHCKEDPKRLRWTAALFGASFAAALVTKVFSLLFVLLLPVILWRLRPSWKRIRTFCLWTTVPFAAVYIGVWHLHFTLADTVLPVLPDDGYYQASEQYKTVLHNGNHDSLFAFPLMLRDSLRFVSHYERGVPALDLCKEDENGSPWFLWPFGARTISYRWETPDSVAYRYLYLVPNPVGWGMGLLGIALSALLLAAPVLLDVKTRVQGAWLLATFLGLYVAYMAAVSRIDRVMYLYHYFLPLLFSFLLFGLAFVAINRIGRWELTENRKTNILLGLGVLIFLSFQVYRPFTYYEPLTDAQVERRALLDLWDLRCVHCPVTNGLVR